ncbi:hypothetical protein LTR53_001003 [Teratosphaeriaceae sp. CCFEE 6253]|nr:hypothetical protein LTR53_001003 [Teratosphaeriaceae sp. CCFEE 6253]
MDSSENARRPHFHDHRSDYDTLDEYVRLHLYPHIAQLDEAIAGLKEQNEKLRMDNKALRTENERLEEELDASVGALPQGASSTTAPGHDVGDRAMRKFSRSIQSLITQSYDAQDTLALQVSQMLATQRSTKTAVDVLAEEHTELVRRLGTVSHEQRAWRDGVDSSPSAIIMARQGPDEHAETSSGTEDGVDDGLKVEFDVTQTVAAQLMQAENEELKQLVIRSHALLRIVVDSLATKAPDSRDSH